MLGHQGVSPDGAVGEVSGEIQVWIYGALDARRDDEQVILGQVQRGLAVELAQFPSTRYLVESIVREHAPQGRPRAIGGHTPFAHPESAQLRPIFFQFMWCAVPK